MLYFINLHVVGPLSNIYYCWKGDQAIKSTCCSCTGRECCSPHPHDGLHAPLNPILLYLTASSVLLGTIYTCKNSLTSIKINIVLNIYKTIEYLTMCQMMLYSVPYILYFHINVYGINMYVYFFFVSKPSS